MFMEPTIHILLHKAIIVLCFPRMRDGILYSNAQGSQMVQDWNGRNPRHDVIKGIDRHFLWNSAVKVGADRRAECDLPDSILNDG